MVRQMIQKGISKGRSIIGGKQETIISAAFVMMVLVAITKVSGLLKVHLFARYFGASLDLDVFWAAFKVPDIIFNVVVVGTMNAALIPTFVEKLGVGGKDGAQKLNDLFSRVLNLFGMIFVVSGILVFILAPTLCRFIVYSGQGNFGFESNDFSAENVDLMVQLMRIMLISPIILGLSSVFTAGMQVNKRFLVPALAPLFYNFGIILGTIVFAVGLDMGVVGLSLGVVLGSVLHLLVQVPLAFALKLKFRLRFNIFDKEMWGIIKLALPRVIGLVGEQVSILVNTVISFGLGEGALSTFQYATSLHYLPIQLIGGTIAQAALPTLSLEYQKSKSPEQRKLIENGDKKAKFAQFRQTFLKSLQQILFLVLPAGVIIFVLRLPIVRLVLGAGEFDWQDTVVTSWVLALFVVAIIGQSMVSLLIRTFYAMKETVVPLVASLLGVTVNIVGAVYLTNFFSHYYDWRPIVVEFLNGSRELFDGTGPGFAQWLSTRNSSPSAVGGLALSIGLALMIESIVLMWILNRRIGVFSWRGLFQPLMKKMVASGAMFSAMYTLFKLWNFSLDTSTVISIVGLTTVVGGVGSVVYLGVCAVIDVSEVGFFMKFARKIYKRGLGVLRMAY